MAVHSNPETGEVVCDDCGAVYYATKHKLPARDKDSLPCQKCGATLIRWNGACQYTLSPIQGRPHSDESSK